MVLLSLQGLHLVQVISCSKKCADCGHSNSMSMHAFSYICGQAAERLNASTVRKEAMILLMPGSQQSGMDGTPSVCYRHDIQSRHVPADQGRVLELHMPGHEIPKHTALQSAMLAARLISVSSSFFWQPHQLKFETQSIRTDPWQS